MVMPNTSVLCCTQRVITWSTEPKGPALNTLISNLKRFYSKLLCPQAEVHQRAAGSCNLASREAKSATAEEMIPGFLDAFTWSLQHPTGPPTITYMCCTAPVEGRSGCVSQPSPATRVPDRRHFWRDVVPISRA